MMELEYSESRRDQLEDELANKREIATRSGDGISVILYWLRKTNTISLAYTDERTNTAYEIIVPNDKALDALAHPNAYAAQAGIMQGEEGWHGQPWA